MKEYFSGIAAVRNNGLIPMLEKEGYEIINHSIFSFKRYPPTVPPFDLWDQFSLYNRHNIFHKIDSDIGWNIRIRFKGFKPQRFDKYVYERDHHLSKVYEHSLQTALSESTRPRFVYSHFMIPHPPYSFDSTGNKIKDPVWAQTHAEDKKSYVAQLIYSNKIIVNLVSHILSNPQRPSVIILQGDHGYKYLDKTRDSLEFKNLNAIYFSNKDYRLLTKDISMVNTFRIVMNTFFKQKIPILKDTSYFLRYK